MNESALLANIRNALGRRSDVRLFRNNVGTLRDREGRYVQYGLCAGSSDLVGWTTVNGIAVLTCIEVKSATGRVTPEQTNFLRVVREAGGLAGVARTVEDALTIVQGTTCKP